MEPRLLLAGDLAGAFNAIADFPSGTQVTVSLQLQNPGDASVKASNVDFFITTEADFDPENPGDAIFIQRSKVGGTLTTGANANVDVKLNIPAYVAAGSYRLVAVLDADEKIAEADEDNNVVISDAVDVTQPDYNLAAQITNKSTFPTAVVSGQTAKGSIEVAITNDGTADIPKSAKAKVVVVARPSGAGDDSQDIVLNTKDVFAAISSLKAGATKTAKVAIEFPANLAEGDYTLVAKVDVNNDLAETNENDNEAQAAGEVTVADPFVNLVPTIDEDKLALPDNTVSGDGTQINLPILLANNGNVPTAKDQTVTITITAHDELSVVDDTVVATFADVKIGAITPGKPKKISFKFALPPGLADGQFSFIVKVDSANVLAESNEDDNEASTDGNNPVTVEEGVVDIVTDVQSSTLAANLVAGNGAKGKVAVDATNDGNVALPKNQLVNVVVSLRPATAVDDSEDVVIGELTNQKIGGLKPDAVKKFNVNVEVPLHAPEDDYIIVARVTPVDALDEESDENNEDESALGVGVAAAFFDVNTNITASTLSDNVVAGDGAKGKVTVTATNDGNVPLPANQMVNVIVCLRPADALDDSEDVIIGQLANQKIGGQKPGAVKSFSVNVEVGIDADENEYVVVAKVVPTDDLEEDDDDNNTHVSDFTVDVAAGFIDLSAQLTASTVANNVIAGEDASGKVTVVVTNDGNVATPANLLVDVTVVLRPVGVGVLALLEEGDIIVGQLTNQKFGAVKAGAGKSFSVNANIDDETAEDEYELVAIVTPVGELEEPGTDNNSDAHATNIHVAAPFVDLNVTTAVHNFAGNEESEGTGTATITVKNDGNVKAQGLGTVEIFASLTGELDGEAVLVGTTNVNFNLNPAAMTNVTVNVTLPTVDSNPAQTYTLISRVSSNVLGDENAENDERVVGSTINVSAEPPVLGLLQGTVTFAQEGIPNDLTVNVPNVGRVGQVTSTGDFTTTAGQSGSYSYTAIFDPQGGKTASLRMLFNGITEDILVALEFKGVRPESVNGNTILFKTAASGTEGSFDAQSILSDLDATPTGFFDFA